MQTSLGKFQTPSGIHRKKFLDGLETVREYWKNGFFDFVIKKLQLTIYLKIIRRFQGRIKDCRLDIALWMSMIEL